MTAAPNDQDSDIPSGHADDEWGIMLRKRSVLALLAGLLLSSAALAACPASASVDPGQNWVRSSIEAQLARKQGGVVDGDSIHYAREDVTLTYKPPTAPGSVSADDFAGCSTGEVCLYTTSSVVASGASVPSAAASASRSRK